MAYNPNLPTLPHNYPFVVSFTFILRSPAHFVERKRRLGAPGSIGKTKEGLVHKILRTLVAGPAGLEHGHWRYRPASRARSLPPNLVGVPHRKHYTLAMKVRRSLTLRLVLITLAGIEGVFLTEIKCI